ncbi:hypothetical protein FM107_01660 [Sphingobacterium sp. JB170]|nr:hypothetical protein FM107_01660 [Sphingobacterium sp. JB170]
MYYEYRKSDKNKPFAPIPATGGGLYQLMDGKERIQPGFTETIQKEQLV